tara:strand:+ start:294 stop:488 length:195 start_codon:yes stop_codon:yes gene_type:complete
MSDLDDFNQPQKQTGITPEFKKIAVDIQVDNICKLLNGKATYYECSDLKTMHKKIVIEYAHETK